MMHLPALVMTGYIKAVIEALGKLDWPLEECTGKIQRLQAICFSCQTK